MADDACEVVGDGLGSGLMFGVPDEENEVDDEAGTLAVGIGVLVDSGLSRARKYSEVWNL